ncbi:MAG: pilin [Candidatus Gracilibacteria bacterium]|nr:pilin [Candidatus Gracilibacteria bacterium]
MKNIFFAFIGIISSIKYSFANDAGLLGDSLTTKQLREGDIHVNDILNIIRGAIDFAMGIAGTIAVIFIIFGAYQILFGSIEQDRSKGKNTIIMAITGFVLASLSWFIIKLIIDNLS